MTGDRELNAGEFFIPRTFLKGEKRLIEGTGRRKGSVAGAETVIPCARMVFASVFARMSYGEYDL